jgi:hypothetical protein
LKTCATLAHENAPHRGTKFVRLGTALVSPTS